jgi:hypothetical protein
MHGTINTTDSTFRRQEAYVYTTNTYEAQASSMCTYVGPAVFYMVPEKAIGGSAWGWLCAT